MAPLLYIYNIIYLRWLPSFSKKKMLKSMFSICISVLCKISCYNCPSYNPTTLDPIVFNLLQVKCEITFRMYVFGTLMCTLMYNEISEIPLSLNLLRRTYYKAYHLDHYLYPISELSATCPTKPSSIWYRFPAFPTQSPPHLKTAGFIWVNCNTWDTFSLPPFG